MTIYTDIRTGAASRGEERPKPARMLRPERIITMYYYFNKKKLKIQNCALDENKFSNGTINVMFCW